MEPVCILTDSTAQFPTTSFPGHHLVNVIPLHVQLNNRLYTDGVDLKAGDLPVSARAGMTPRVRAPSPEAFRRTFVHLEKRYHQIVVILLSSYLSPAVAHAMEAAATVQGRLSIQVIDSLTTAVGLGLLVQAAAQAADCGCSPLEIQRLVRGLITKIYTVFFIEGLTYLSHSGYLGPAQAIVGEILGIKPLLILENGRLTPTQKARNYRHLVDTLHEFICEFGEVRHIAFVQGVPPYEQETRSLRERVAEDFPSTPISEHVIGTALAALLGPRSLGLFVMEP